MNILKSKKGVTFIELLIVIAMIIMIFGSIITVQSQFLNKNYLETNTHQALQNIRLAQMRAISNYQNSEWGVYFDDAAETYIVFKGDDYTIRDASYDITNNTSGTIDLANINLQGGGNEIIFNKGTGETANFGAFGFSNSQNQTNTIFINSKGIVGLTQLNSSTGGGDSTAPEDILDLAASNPADTSIDLSWTAPGDDDDTGTAIAYDIRYYTSTINIGNWDLATQVSGEPAPQIAGTSESMTISGLSESTTYYFAMKSMDEVPNESGLSNVDSETTLAPATCEVDYAGTYIEAENYSGTITQGTATFIEETSQAGYEGAGYLRSNGGDFTAPPINEGKEYTMNFPTTGTYTVWMRGYAVDTTDNSIFIGLNGTWVGALREYSYSQWSWTTGIQTGANTINITTSGENTLNIWVREPGHLTDALYITQGTETPTGSAGVTVINPTNCGGGGPAPDTTPPNDVSDLSTNSPTGSSLNIAWTSPGDDANSGTADSYDIRYSTSTINDGNWASATQVSGEPAPSVAGTSESMIVNGLSGSTTYYFAIKTSDEVPNESAISNIASGATSDTTAPSAVADLAIQNPTKNSIEVTWTAPGDDGSTGTATTYDVRYSTSAINDGNWALATQISGEPAPSIAGSSEIVTVVGLTDETTYYFAIRTSDEVPNESAISNSPSGTTLQKDNTFRITEYYLGAGVFSGTTYDLTLDQGLEDNYFVILEGADGDGSGNNSTTPDENYAAIISDPNGTDDLSGSGAPNLITLERDGDYNSWVGVVKVVECLGDCTASGFELVGVEEITHSGNNETGNITASNSWTDENQVTVIGGFNGAGCQSTSTSTAGHKSCQVQIWPSGTDTIDWKRSIDGGSLGNAVSTVMIVEWGSEWTIQQVEISGNNGGNGADSTAEYDTGVISPIARDNTWVWGTGWTKDGGIGDSAEGTLITLGDGINQNATESTIAVGQEYSDDRVFTVYALTHPDAQVDYRFKTDGNQNNTTVDVTTDTIANTTARMAIVTNGCNGTGGAFSRPIMSARYTTDSNIRIERRRTGQSFPAWIQGIDLSEIRY